MSFKREGKDKGLLDNLKRRRIKELFAEGIPEDEAKLLCNGRFACLVCSHNPIFDTVSMLMVHRQGKKHAAGEAVFLRKKKELRALIQKRKHEQYMKDGTTDIKQATPAVLGGISFSDPYDPRIKKKHKMKPYERRQRLDLLHSTSSNTTVSPLHPSSSDTLIPTASGLPCRHSHQLKNIFHPMQRPQVPAQPYVSHRHGNIDIETAHHPMASNSTPPQSSVLSRKQDASVKQGLSGSSFSDCQQSGCCVKSASYNRVPASFTQTSSNSTKLAANGSSMKLEKRGQQNCGALVGNQNGVSAEQHGQSCDRTTCVGFGTGAFTGSGGAAAENRDITSVQSHGFGGVGETMAQKYHLLGGSGWKKDWDGKWIRDEDAEFDSDEDPPDLP